MTTKTYKLDENVLAFTISRHAWGNRKKADKNKMETDMDKKMLNATKKLLDSEEWKDVVHHLSGTKAWVINHSMPSFFLKGTYLFKKEMVEEVERYIQHRREELTVLVERFIDAYELQIEMAKDLLKGQFKRSDYPSRQYLRQAFGTTTRWLAFDVPKGLPKELYEAEKKKTQEMWQEAAEQITMALRESFLKLISHLTEKLNSGKDEKKIFRDSMIDKINAFIDNFQMRNLTNDTQLANLVTQAKEIISGVDADDLRNSNRLKNAIRLKFNRIEKELDGMIEIKKVRKFDFDEE